MSAVLLEEVFEMVVLESRRRFGFLALLGAFALGGLFAVWMASGKDPQTTLQKSSEIAREGLSDVRDLASTGYHGARRVARSLMETAMGSPPQKGTTESVNSGHPTTTEALQDRARHGGLLAMSKEFLFEVVMGQDFLGVYLYDLKLKPLPISGVRLSALVTRADGQTASVELKPSFSTDGKPGCQLGTLSLPAGPQAVLVSLSADELPGTLEKSAHAEVTFPDVHGRKLDGAGHSL